VRDDFTPVAFEVVNSNRRLRSEALRHFLARPPTWLRTAIRTVSPAGLRRNLYERAKEFNTVREPRLPLAEATTRALDHRFDEEIRRLGLLLDRDLSGWMTPRGTAD
jgi:hypothetical protein